MGNHHILELLAPAKSADYGIEAIKHGADAVYIGAPAFGARASVGNSVEDIARLVDYAHLFDAGVYVALNTILTDEELPQAVELAHRLYESGADALIIQDMGLLESALPPIPIHASTQMDNVSPERIAYLSALGFEQAVVARELSPREIATIHRLAPNLRLEAFVHGALCVSYSGRCYAASAFHKGRSANRGNCSQVCRLPFDLYDGRGQLLRRSSHLLSIKDLNRSLLIPELIEAGVSSFKIEGRLKDLSYVKTVTAHYHQLLNDFIAKHKGYQRRSKGRVTHLFTPDVNRTFNRGFTSFAHRGRGADDLAAFDTPKSMGQAVGTVSQIKQGQVKLHLKSGIQLANGDGLAYHCTQGGTAGIRVNKAQQDTIVPHGKVSPNLTVGMTLYRNNDIAFEREMSGVTAERVRPIVFVLSYYEGTISLSARVVDLPSISCKTDMKILLEIARKGDQGDSIRSVLEKLGDSQYTLDHIDMDSGVSALFIPRSILTSMRRVLCDLLDDSLRKRALAQRHPPTPYQAPSPYQGVHVGYTTNIYNAKAQLFYHHQEAVVDAPAYEIFASDEYAVMFTKHCIRYSLNMCPHLQGYKGALYEPWRLSSPEREVEMRIDFDCKECMMRLYAIRK